MRALLFFLLSGVASVSIAATEPAWLVGDLHVHTTFSHDVCDPADPLSENCRDAPYALGFTPAGQIQQAELRGLDFVAITDHGTVAQQNDPGFASDTVLLLPSYEHSLASGHAGLHGVRERFHVDTSTEDGAQALVDSVRALGGVFVVNHPASTGSEWEYASVARFDAVEAWNGPWQHRDPVPAASNNEVALARFEALASMGARAAIVGGSDSHWISASAIAGVGQPATHVLAAERSVQGVLDGIRARHTFVTAQFEGPELRVDAECGSARGIMGDSLPADGSECAIRVRVLAGPGLEAFLDTPEGRRSLGIAVGLDDTLEATVRATRGSWALALLAQPDAGEVIALATPVFFD